MGEASTCRLRTTYTLGYYTILFHLAGSAARHVECRLLEPTTQTLLGHTHTWVCPFPKSDLQQRRRVCGIYASEEIAEPSEWPIQLLAVRELGETAVDRPERVSSSANTTVRGRRQGAFSGVDGAVARESGDVAKRPPLRTRDRGDAAGEFSRSRSSPRSSILEAGKKFPCISATIASQNR